MIIKKLCSWFATSVNTLAFAIGTFLLCWLIYEIITARIPPEDWGRPMAPPPAEQRKPVDHHEQRTQFVIGLVVGCESGGRLRVWGDAGKSYGIAQFRKATFNDMKRRAHMPELKWKDPVDQLTLMSWAFQHGYAHHWRCWRDNHKRYEAMYDNHHGLLEKAS